jgi:hypothetical protein
MHFPRIILPVAALLALANVVSCSKPTGVPDSSAKSGQKLPFDREASTKGISPSQSLIPPTRRLLEGTSISVRLRNTYSSATAHAGDTFQATLDEPVIVDDQPLIPRGSPVIGRVLDAQRATEGGRNPGYLRLALVSLGVGGKPIAIETSSIFAKGNATDEHAPETTADGTVNRSDIALTPDRRLTFHLTQPIDLP